MHTPHQRRHRIQTLLDEYAIHSQAQLAELLAGDGIQVNQATLSRDLKALGIVKGPDGYTVPAELSPPNTERILARAVAQWLRDAIPTQNQVVLKTPPGGAQPLALAIDQARLDEIVGTIAGDDTILAICKSNQAANRIATELLAAS
ncbi:MAG: arginine repressor [Planctomycetes bacterium]|nr:arginine repressor [Planctomycetota bacterium]